MTINVAVLALAGALSGASDVYTDNPPVVSEHTVTMTRDSLAHPLDESHLGDLHRRVLEVVLHELRERIAPDERSWGTPLEIAILRQTNPTPSIAGGTYVIGDEYLTDDALRDFDLDSFEGSVEIGSAIMACGLKPLTLRELPPNRHVEYAVLASSFADHSSLHDRSDRTTILFTVSRPRVSFDGRSALVTVTNAIVDPYHFIYLVSIRDEDEPTIEWVAEHVPGC